MEITPVVCGGNAPKGSTALFAAVALMLALRAGHANAEAAPDRYRSAAYYSVHGSAIVILSAGAIAARGARGLEAGWDSDFFPGDRSVRGNYALSAADTSDIGLALVLANPVAAQFGLGIGKHSLNAGLVYTETLALNLALNSVTKVLVGRPRPSTYRLREAGATPDLEWFVSFYSGHASTAFAAAISGSYLFAEGTRDREARYVLWGTELGLAAATATLRVRAGKHYYSDVALGTLIGTAVGVGVPLIHGASHRPELGEYAAGGAGLVLGIAAGALFPFAHDLMSPSSTALRWSIHPSAGGPGLEISGTF